MTVSRWYCPLPFKHVYVDNTGVSSCCQTPRFNLSIDEYLDSNFLKNLQKEFSEGTVPSVCLGCVKEEAVTGFSLRTGSLADYNQVFIKTDIDFVDYRASNICNFKCRSCEPTFSHGIANETRNNSTLQKYFTVIDTKTAHVSDTNVKWINQNLHQIKRLMLTGGEPTRMPEVRDLLERVVYDNLDINILITTNASFEDDFWCELTRKSSNLHWTISLDAVGCEAEIIRHGTKWSQVERNVRWLSQNSQSVNFNTVISNLNVLQLKPLLEFVNEMQVESRYPRGLHGDAGCRHQFHICQRPYYLAADNWPNDLKPDVLNHLQQCLTLDLDREQQQTINGLLAQIQNSRFDSTLWMRTTDYNNTLDQIRNENHNILYQRKLS